MLAAIEFDTHLYLSLACGQNIHSIADLVTDPVGLTNVYAPAWERQLAATLDYAAEPVDHLFLVLPDELHDRRRAILSRRRQGALPVLHPVRRSEAILGGLRLLESPGEVNGTVVDISFTGTSVWSVEDGFFYPDTDDPPLALSTATLLDRTAAALAGVEEFTAEDDEDEEEVRCRTWEAAMLLNDGTLPGGCDGDERQLRARCLADYAGECTREIETLRGDELDQAGTVYLAGSGARLMAPWLFPGRADRVCPLTAREYFVGQGALAAELPFVLDFVQEWRRDRPKHRPRGDKKSK